MSQTHLPATSRKPSWQAHVYVPVRGGPLVQVPRPSPQGFPAHGFVAVQVLPSPSKPVLHLQVTSPAVLLGSKHFASVEHGFCSHSLFIGTHSPAFGTKPSLHAHVFVSPGVQSVALMPHALPWSAPLTAAH